MRYKTVIFDFDGTICDTGEGILKSAKFALDYYNIEAPNYTELTYFIGPPLLVTFQEKFGVDAAMADKLVKKYRERYTNKGLLESKLYDGIKELLAKLKAENLKLGIASSKPQDYIEALLDHYGVKSYFLSPTIIDSLPEASSSFKQREIIFAFDSQSAENVTPQITSKYDIEGAKANMIDSVGVLWGYGNRVEFAGAGAKFVAEKIDDIFSIALGYFEQTQEVQGIFSGRIIDVHNDKVMLVDGDIADREVVDHPGGVGIIGLTDENEILLVRQFRYPYKETIYEIPAGKLEKGEDPRQAGIREFSEECGAKAEVFESLGEIYPSPGYCGEIIRLFYAKGISYGEQHLDDDEFLDVIKMPIKEVITKIMTNEIKDAKTIAAIFKLKELMNL